MQLGFYFDQCRCTGCYTCIVACKDWHDVEAGPASWISVTAAERGKFPDLFLSYLFLPCLHCANPVCAKACPVHAITKRQEEGVVIVDREVCLGGEECKFACRKVCPSDAPQFGAEPNPKMQKCEFCVDRWAEKKKPICVEACPMRALDAGPMDALRAKYGGEREAIGFVYKAEISPSIIFKPKGNV